MKIDNEILIALVEARPIIWDKNDPSYCDRWRTRDAWLEICCEMIEGFDEKDEDVKDIIYKTLSRRWNRIQSYFKITLKNVKKRNKYVHSDQLSFLIPFCIGSGKSDDSNHELERSDEISDNEQLHATNLCEVVYEEKNTEALADKKMHSTDEMEFKKLDSLEPGSSDICISSPNESVLEELQSPEPESSNSHGDFLNESELNNSNSLKAESSNSHEEFLNESELNHSNSLQTESSNSHGNSLNESALNSSDSLQAESSNAYMTIHNEKEIESKRLKLLEPDSPNAHMAFFQSMLPHLNNFSDSEVLEFQMSVLQEIRSLNNRRTQLRSQNIAHPNSPYSLPWNSTTVYNPLIRGNPVFQPQTNVVQEIRNFDERKTIRPQSQPRRPYTGPWSSSSNPLLTDNSSLQQQTSSMISWLQSQTGRE